jgi:hypothetical protein
MILFSMESVFLILSGVIFMAGILYWFWSHIQLTQKKVLLLESAVFELRSQMTKFPDSSGPSGSSGLSGYKTTYADLADDWEEEKEDISGSPVEVGASNDSDIPDDLRPGGRISTEQSELPPMPETQGAEDTQSSVEKSNSQFRELFINETHVQSADSPSVPSPLKNPESLDSMSLKELRRLADQRGIANSNELRKKEILSALRQQINPPTNDVNIVQLNDDAVSVTEILE